MLYPARWKKITVDQSKVPKNRLFRFFWPPGIAENMARYYYDKAGHLFGTFFFLTLFLRFENICFGALSLAYISTVDILVIGSAPKSFRSTRHSKNINYYFVYEVYSSRPTPLILVAGAPEHFEFWRGKISGWGHICLRSSARERSDRAGGGYGYPLPR